MPGLPPKQTAKQRASFARADRLRREAAAGRPETRREAERKNQPPPPDRKPSARRGPQQERSPRAAERERNTPPRDRGAPDDRRRAEIDKGTRLRAAWLERQEQRREDHRRELIRKAFASYADNARGREQQQRTERRRAETAKGVRLRAEWTKRQEQRREERRRQDIRRSFARKAENVRAREQRQRDEQQRARLKETERKAAAAIEADHKRQREEQQRAHRRDTDQVRNRHRREMESLFDNETRVIERHAGAIRRLDAAEQRDLSELAIRQRSLPGRLAGLKPGSGEARERATQAVRDRYDADRMQAHHDLEALKERQFTHAQATRLQHARERLVSIHTHHDKREQLRARQETERPGLVEQRRDIMVREQERAHERQQERHHERAPVRELSPEFGRVR